MSHCEVCRVGDLGAYVEKPEVGQNLLGGPPQTDREPPGAEPGLSQAWGPQHGGPVCWTGPQRLVVAGRTRSRLPRTGVRGRPL